MQSVPPPFPPHRPSCFRATVHGTVFGGRAALVDRVRPGDLLVLVPGPPTEDQPGVWVHLPDGDVLGHLPPEIECWLARWLLAGGKARACALQIRGREEPSWRRLLLEVTCEC